MIDGFRDIAVIVQNNGYEKHTFQELLEWVEERKQKQKVAISIIPLNECYPWYYDTQTGCIQNPDKSFFQVAGVQCMYPSGEYIEQPIIIQKEIGFLGIICKMINGVWHFLMQAKIEPGNINYVQISPTIQATKSNFTRLHGGKEPLYLDFFKHMKSSDVLVDQIQSEQSSRFWGKRNRNVIIKTDQDIEETDSHKWMTLNQLRSFMLIDNCINMDTRTVLSCIPYVFISDNLTGYELSFIESIKTISRETIKDVYIRENDYKMFSAPQITFAPLKSLKAWNMNEYELVHKEAFPYKIIFCNIEIEGREVAEWNQPLFAACGAATFGLICSKSSGILEILVQLKHEIGCFDSIELGPTVQEEYNSKNERNHVEQQFYYSIQRKDNVLVDVVLSEEGGRFFHEQNRNIIVMVNKEDIEYDSDQYVWASVGTLNAMTMINNCLNIQLRNLLMLLSMYCK